MQSTKARNRRSNQPVAMKSGVIAVALTSALGLAPTPAVAVDQPYSEAEKSLFLTNHMKNVPAPSTLRYSFEKAGALEQGFKDDAVVTLTPGSTAGNSVAKVNYLTGAHNYKVPAVPQAEGNPIILSYLERELQEMKRLTGGSSNYYRKRIRLALVDEATVKPVKVKYAGTEINAREIRISPYVHDPARSRYEKFADKYYVFTVSDQIPGGVYQMRGVLPAQAAGNDKPGPLLEETLTFAGLSKQ